MASGDLNGEGLGECVGVRWGNVKTLGWVSYMLIHEPVLMKVSILRKLWVGVNEFVSKKITESLSLASWSWPIVQSINVNPDEDDENIGLPSLLKMESWLRMVSLTVEIRP